MTKSTIAREQATDKEIQMLIDSHENGTAMFMRIDAYYFMAKELQERRKADGEPVAWTWQHLKQWHVTNDEERVRDLAWDGVKVEPLYRHAQQPVAHIPVLYKGAELLSRSGLELIRDGASFATDLESACMAEALLAAAQPEPVVPDAATAIRACLSEFQESVRDIVEECADIAENSCRAAMLYGVPAEL